MYDSGMRITITLDKETVSILDQYAHANGVSRASGAALLVKRGLHPPRIKYEDGWPVLDLPRPRRTITTEFVKSLEDEW